jgi:hypothetical protein
MQIEAPLCTFTLAENVSPNTHNEYSMQEHDKANVIPLRIKTRYHKKENVTRLFLFTEESGAVN